MVSTLITVPQGIKAGADATFSVSFKNMNLGTSNADPEADYLKKPQALGAGGVINGQYVCQMQSIDKASGKSNVTFTKVVNDQVSGQGSFNVVVPGTAITDKGSYRFGCFAVAETFQPVIMPVAQRGSQDDIVHLEL
jgi:hypothetical protein